MAIQPPPVPQPMSQNERYKAYLDIAQFAFKCWDARRQYEWKITLAWWALLAVAIAKKNDLRLEVPWWILVLVLVLYEFLWRRGVWAANERDKKICFYFRDAADEVLRNPAYVPAETADQRQRISWCCRSLGFLRTWVTWFDLVVTALLLAAFWFTPIKPLGTTVLEK